MRALPLAIVLSGWAGLMTAHGQISPLNHPWPPAMQGVGYRSPPLSPAEAVKTFHMPPGYYLELVASEPLVQDPIAMSWDTHGRLWVVELPTFLRTLRNPEPDLDPICRIVVLEDSHHTGRLDKRTVFADRLVQPRSVKVLDCGVLVGEPPYIWLMHDSDGDLHMHSKELISSNYGWRKGDVENNSNGFLWALDNWMHTSESEVYLRLKNGHFEVRPTLLRGQWGESQDDAGRIFRNTSTSPIHVDLVPTPYYIRNPSLVRTRGSYETLGTSPAIDTVWPVRPTPGTNRSYQHDVVRPDGSLESYTAACAPLVYRGDRLPAELYGNIFVAEPAGNLVTRNIVRDDGTGLQVGKAYARGDFLASTDERFRPVYLSNGPDGTLYIVDMYRGAIQERNDMSQYLVGQIENRELEQPLAKGRIYRVRHEGMARDQSPALAGASTAQLVAALSHPNGWRRDEAQRMLVERGSHAAAPALGELARTAPEARTRLHALWTLDGIDALEPGVVIRALSDPSRDVRVSAIRLSERWLAEANPAMQAAVTKLLDDPDWWVREQLAASLGYLPSSPRETVIAVLLERHGDDPVVVDAALSGLRGSEPAMLDLLLRAGGGPNPRREAAVIMLSATIVRGAQDAPVQTLLARVADESTPAWQRSDLLRGAEVAVLGAAMPGAVADHKGVPIDHLAPGGGYAFAKGPVQLITDDRGARSLRLNREPAALTALAQRGGDFGSRAGRVLERVLWPGKPGTVPLAPLTPAEQRRFEDGHEVFRNVCQACHQPDGRGQAGLAANLIDSPLALAPAAVTIRILLNGKEGAIGLMPPVGAVLSDENIASVLTYVRREWGQTASPVDPATVRDVRARTAGRQKAWTNAELLALPEMRSSSE